MKRYAVALVGLLFWGILTMWVEERWAWALFQTGISVLAAIRLFDRKHPFLLRAAYLPLAAAAAWPLLQLASGQTTARGATWDAAFNWETFLLVFVLACDTLSHLDSRVWFLKTVSLGAALLALISTAQKYSSGGRIFWLFPSGYSADVLGPFVNRNQYSAWIELLLPVALYLAVTEGRSRLLYATGAAIMLSSVIAAGSRMGSALVLTETVCVALLFAVRTEVRPGTLLLRAAQFAGLAALAVAVAGSHTLLTRLQTMGPEPMRIDALHASLKMIGDRPWTGYGLGTWSTIYPRYASLDTGEFMNQAHNDWIQWAAEGGVPFLLFLLVFAACLFKPAFKSIYGVGVLAFLLHALVDYPMQQRPALAGWMFAMAGAALAAGNPRGLYRK
jgi:O-antigen ligase